MANNPELFGVLSFIRAHPEQHDQKDFVSAWGSPASEAVASVDRALECGTTACLAGWTVILHDSAAAQQYVSRGSEGDFMRRAKEILGLTSDQAAVLFLEAQTLRDLEAVAEAIRRDPQIGLEELYSVLASVPEVEQR